MEDEPEERKLIVSSERPVSASRNIGQSSRKEAIIRIAREFARQGRGFLCSLIWDDGKRPLSCTRSRQSLET